MPDLGPGGRVGARRRTRRRMMAVNERSNAQEQPETMERPEHSDKLVKLARLLKDKGFVSKSEYNLIFAYYFFYI